MTLQEQLLAVRKWIHDIETVENPNPLGLGDIEKIFDDAIDDIEYRLNIDIPVPEDEE